MDVLLALHVDFHKALVLVLNNSFGNSPLPRLSRMLRKKVLSKNKTSTRWNVVRLQREHLFYNCKFKF